MSDLTGTMELKQCSFVINYMKEFVLQKLYSIINSVRDEKKKGKLLSEADKNFVDKEINLEKLKEILQNEEEKRKLFSEISENFVAKEVDLDEIQKSSSDVDLFSKDFKLSKQLLLIKRLYKSKSFADDEQTSDTETAEKQFNNNTLKYNKKSRYGHSLIQKVDGDAVSALHESNEEEGEEYIKEFFSKQNENREKTNADSVKECLVDEDSENIFRKKRRKKKKILMTSNVKKYTDADLRAFQNSVYYKLNAFGREGDQIFSELENAIKKKRLTLQEKCIFLSDLGKKIELISTFNFSENIEENEKNINKIQKLEEQNPSTFPISSKSIKIIAEFLSNRPEDERSSLFIRFLILHDFISMKIFNENIGFFYYLNDENLCEIFCAQAVTTIENFEIVMQINGTALYDFVRNVDDIFEKFFCLMSSINIDFQTGHQFFLDSFLGSIEKNKGHFLYFEKIRKTETFEEFKTVIKEIFQDANVSRELKRKIPLIFRDSLRETNLRLSKTTQEKYETTCSLLKIIPEAESFFNLGSRSKSHSKTMTLIEENQFLLLKIEEKRPQKMHFEREQESEKYSDEFLIEEFEVAKEEFENTFAEINKQIHKIFGVFSGELSLDLKKLTEFLLAKHGGGCEILEDEKQGIKIEQNFSFDLPKDDFRSEEFKEFEPDNYEKYLRDTLIFLTKINSNLKILEEENTFEGLLERFPNDFNSYTKQKIVSFLDKQPLSIVQQKLFLLNVIIFSYFVRSNFGTGGKENSFEIPLNLMINIFFANKNKPIFEFVQAVENFRNSSEFKALIDSFELHIEKGMSFKKTLTNEKKGMHEEKGGRLEEEENAHQKLLVSYLKKRGFVIPDDAKKEMAEERSACEDKSIREQKKQGVQNKTAKKQKNESEATKEQESEESSGESDESYEYTDGEYNSYSEYEYDEDSNDNEEKVTEEPRVDDDLANQEKQGENKEKKDGNPEIDKLNNKNKSGIRETEPIFVVTPPAEQTGAKTEPENNADDDNSSKEPKEEVGQGNNDGCKKEIEVLCKIKEIKELIKKSNYETKLLFKETLEELAKQENSLDIFGCISPNDLLDKFEEAQKKLDVNFIKKFFRFLQRIVVDFARKIFRKKIEENNSVFEDLEKNLEDREKEISIKLNQKIDDLGGAEKLQNFRDQIKGEKSDFLQVEQKDATMQQ